MPVDDAARAGHPHATPTPSCRARSSRTCSTCSTAATRARSSATCAPASCGTAWRARIRAAQGRPRAGHHQRRHDPRPRPVLRQPARTAAASASSTRRWSTRRGPGQTFLLGASTWRIEDITRDRVIVTPAPGAPGAVPFWRGDSIGRPRELGEAVGAFARWAVEQDAETLRARLRPRRARRAQPARLPARAAGRPRASSRATARSSSSASATRSATGGVCVLSPYGGRVHAAWGLALCARIRDEYGLESDAIWSDDGIIVHLPDADEPPGAELMLIEPDRLEDLVVGELGGSALFGARFRENAGRALLIPRAYPGRRTPLWQQRLKSQTLLEVAKRYAQFPIVLETYRECLRDVLDLPGLEELLTKLHSRELTRGRGRDADRVAVRVLAAVRLRRDVHVRGRHAQRRAPRRRAGAGPRPAARAARPGGAARPDRPGRRWRRSRPTSSGARSARGPTPPTRLHDVLRRVGDLTDGRAARALDGRLRRRCSTADRRAIAIRLAGEERWIAAEDAGLYRDALGVVPPRRHPGRVPRGRARTRWSASPAAGRARTARSRPAALKAPLRRRLQPRARRSSSAPAISSAASCAPAARRASGATPRCCAGCAAPRWPPCARRSSRPTSARWRRFYPSWQGVDRHPPTGAGVDRLREALVPLQGLALPADVWERDVLPRRVGAYSPTWLDQLCASGEVVWVGAGSLGPLSRARRAATSARTRRSSARRRCRAAPSPPDGEIHERLRDRLRAGACFFTDLLVDLAGVPAEEIQEALWDLVWAGEVTNDAWAPLRSPKLAAARAAGLPARPRWSAASRFAGRKRGAQPAVQGRWSLTAPLFAAGDGDPAGPPPRAGRAAARALRHRHPRAGAGRGHPRRLLRPLRLVRRAGDARRRAAAATSSRASAARSSRCPARSSACARSATTTASGPSSSPPPTRPSPTAPCSSGRRREGRSPVAHGRRLRRPRRRRAVLYVERGGKGLQVLVDDLDERIGPAAGRARRRRPPRPHQAPGARARRRRAGGRLGVGGRACSSSASAAGRASSPSAPMPEGDTIHYAANRIRPVLEGHVPDEIRTAAPALRARPLAGAAGRARGAVASTRAASTCSSASRAA